MSVQDRLRQIEDQMANPKTTNEEIEKLLETYYELLEVQNSTNLSNKKKL